MRPPAACAPSGSYLISALAFGRPIKSHLRRFQKKHVWPKQQTRDKINRAGNIPPRKPVHYLSERSPVDSKKALRGGSQAVLRAGSVLKG